MKPFLAVDIGASSGRHILGWKKNGKMVTKEIYRFENQMINKDAKLCWDTERLFGEILEGMKKCRQEGIIPYSMGIDTWAVDFALLDKKGELLGPVVGYRDNRTGGMDKKVYERVPEDELYARTGIQKQSFNTIYQFMAVREQTPELLEQAEKFLLIPDYFHYRLTGKAVAEYTNATTTQLVNARSGEWDWELIRKCGFPEKIFPKIRQPGTILGELTEEIRKKVGFNCKVVLPATHDTGSAVMAMPCREDTGLYISSGTWSLMGTEVKNAVCTEESQSGNFTNEGGYDHRFRYLKNIMGLWMIQCLRHEKKDAYSFAELCRMAEECGDFPSRVNVNDESFLAPESMTEAVKEYCRRTGQRVPESVGELAGVIYQSLAGSYGDTLRELEILLGKKYECIYVIGGGANADYLNTLTARATKRIVYAGPAEATAIGNLTAQMISAGIFKGLKEARECISRSWDIKVFMPDGKGEK